MFFNGDFNVITIKTTSFLILRKCLTYSTQEDIVLSPELKVRVDRIDQEISSFRQILINGTLSSIRKFTEAELILNFAQVGLQSCEIPWWLTDATLIEFMTLKKINRKELSVGVWSHSLNQNRDCLKIAFKRLGFTLHYELNHDSSWQLLYTIQKEAFSLTIYSFSQGIDYTWQTNPTVLKRFYYSNFYIDWENYFPIPSTFPLYSEEQYGKHWKYAFQKGILNEPTHNELLPCENQVILSI